MVNPSGERKNYKKKSPTNERKTGQIVRQQVLRKNSVPDYELIINESSKRPTRYVGRPASRPAQRPKKKSKQRKKTKNKKQRNR